MAHRQPLRAGRQAPLPQAPLSCPAAPCNCVRPAPFAFALPYDCPRRVHASTVRRNVHHEARLTRPPTPRSDRLGKLARRLAGAAACQMKLWGAAQGTCASKVAPGQAHSLGPRYL